MAVSVRKLLLAGGEEELSQDCPPAMEMTSEVVKPLLIPSNGKNYVLLRSTRKMKGVSQS